MPRACPPPLSPALSNIQLPSLQHFVHMHKSFTPSCCNISCTHMPAPAYTTLPHTPTLPSHDTFIPSYFCATLTYVTACHTCLPSSFHLTYPPPIQPPTALPHTLSYIRIGGCDALRSCRRRGQQGLDRMRDFPFATPAFLFTSQQPPRFGVLLAAPARFIMLAANMALCLGGGTVPPGAAFYARFAPPSRTLGNACGRDRATWAPDLRAIYKRRGTPRRTACLLAVCQHFSAAQGCRQEI